MQKKAEAIPKERIQQNVPRLDRKTLKITGNNYSSQKEKEIESFHLLLCLPALQGERRNKTQAFYIVQGCQVVVF